MADFRAHEGWCSNGVPPDGRRRLDMFPEWGDAFPLWERGDGCSDEPFSQALRDALYVWNRDWEVQANALEAWSKQSRTRWWRRGDEIGRRVESETGAVVVVLGPERLGPPRDCPHCGSIA